jgi:two-component system chemotaxis response regulator CheB
LVERDATFSLSVDPKICFVRPSIDVLFQSAADAYGPGLAAVVLTGANEDGAAGLKRVRDRGGIGIVQDPAEAEAPEMPAAALMLAGADHVLPLERIPALLNSFCGCGTT